MSRPLGPFARFVKLDLALARLVAESADPDDPRWDIVLDALDHLWWAMTDEEQTLASQLSQEWLATIDYIEETG